jgi:PII-like signaling protein
MVSVIDKEEQIQELLPYLDQMLAGGLVASSTVDAIRYTRSGERPSKTV